MTYEDFQRFYIVSDMNAWEHDFYTGVIESPMSEQEFFTYAHEKVADIQIWFRLVGNAVYFIVAKDTVLPEDFLVEFTPVTGVPTEAPTV